MVRRFGARAARMVRDGAAGLYTYMRSMVRARMPAGPVELQPLGPHPVEKPEVELTVPAYHRVPLDAEVVADPGRHISSVAFDEGALDDPAGSVSEDEEHEEGRKEEVEGRLAAVGRKLRLLRLVPVDPLLRPIEEEYEEDLPVAGDEAGADDGLPATPAAGAEDEGGSLLSEPGSAAGGVPVSVLEPEKEKVKVSARNRF